MTHLIWLNLYVSQSPGQIALLHPAAGNWPAGSRAVAAATAGLLNGFPHHSLPQSMYPSLINGRGNPGKSFRIVPTVLLETSMIALRLLNSYACAFDYDHMANMVRNEVCLLSDGYWILHLSSFRVDFLALCDRHKSFQPISVL